MDAREQGLCNLGRHAREICSEEQQQPCELCRREPLQAPGPAVSGTVWIVLQAQPVAWELAFRFRVSVSLRIPPGWDMAEKQFVGTGWWRS